MSSAERQSVRSLAVKLTLAFVTVTLLSVAVVAFEAMRQWNATKHK